MEAHSVIRLTDLIGVTLLSHVVSMERKIKNQRDTLRRMSRDRKTSNGMCSAIRLTDLIGASLFVPTRVVLTKLEILRGKAR